MVFTITGNLGILSQSRLERISRDATSNTENTDVKLNKALERIKKLEQREGALPSSITRKRDKARERGLEGGKTEEGAKKSKDKKIEAVDLKPSVFDSLFIALGLKGKLPSSLAAGVGPLSGFSQAKKIQNIESLQKKIFGKVIIKESAIGGKAAGLFSGALGFTQRGAFAQAVFSTFLTRVIPVAILMKLASAVWKIYKAQYGKGGTRDIRKLILAEDISRIGIENENELESGANLFLSNPQLLTGLPRGPSNTENLREGLARWKQRHEGSYS